MTSFYLISLFLFIVALWFVFYPFLKSSDIRNKKSIEITNVNVIKARIKEIEQEAAEGLISQDVKQQSIDEVKLALVDETIAEPKSTGVSSKVALIVGAIPTLIIGIWVYIDANQLSGLSDLMYALNNTDELNQRIVLQPANDVSPQEFQQYALIIRHQLRNRPNDATGWTWLGRLNMTLGQIEQSQHAFKKALTISPQNEDIRVRYAQASMMLGSDEGLQMAKNQLTYLLSQNSNNREYRLLMTVVGAQLNDQELAFSNFKMIKDMLDPSGSLYQSLVAQLREMGAPEDLFKLNALSSGDEQSQVEPNNNELLSSEKTKVELLIDVTEEMRKALPKEAFLIVFAQDSAGDSRVPLAVKKLSMPDFPVRLTLSEEDSMIEGLSLTNTNLINITARISLDEDVMPSAGDLEGKLEQIDISAKPSIVEIIIDKELL